MTDNYGDGNEKTSRPESVSSDFNNISEVSIGLANDTKNNVLLHKCRLCKRLARAFFCPECLKNGNFTHSRERCHERFADKKLKLYGLTEERGDSIKEIEQVVQDCFSKTKVRQVVREYEDGVKLLRLAVQEKNSKISEIKEETCQISDEVYNFKQKRQSKMEKLQRMQRYVDSTHEKTEAERKKLEERILALNQLRKENINQLVTYIFPVTEADSSSGDSQFMEEEATFQIVESHLPKHGNYSAYLTWILEHRESLPAALAEAGPRNPAYNIGAALTYTSQLVAVLAFYLDVQLPKDLCYSEFCSHELSERKFAYKVAKLNVNALYLCLSQNVGSSFLHPRYTLGNITQLLHHNINNLSRSGPISLSMDFPSSVEESMLKDLSFSDDEKHASDEEADLEWENVPNLPTIEYGPPVQGSSLLYSQGAQSSSLAGGLMSSAAALWRAATGQK